MELGRFCLNLQSFAVIDFVMESIISNTAPFPVRDLPLRLVPGEEERKRWDSLIAQYHNLPFLGLLGKGWRQVAIHDETWLALLVWQAGAFKVRVRDGWIGWSAEQQFSRSPLIANNDRFLALQEGRLPNLASRAHGLSRAAGKTIGVKCTVIQLLWPKR